MGTQRLDRWLFVVMGLHALFGIGLVLLLRLLGPEYIRIYDEYDLPRPFLFHDVLAAMRIAHHHGALVWTGLVVVLTADGGVFAWFAYQRDRTLCRAWAVMILVFLLVMAGITAGSIWFAKDAIDGTRFVIAG